MTATVEPGITVKPACPKACAACPWRLTNQGAEHPHKFYAASNLARLWRRLRRGERMSCHPTDPRMAEFDGYEDQAGRDKAHECAGALILVQREFMTFQQSLHVTNALAAYRKQRPNGLSRAGLIAVAERAMCAWPGEVAMSTPDLSDAEIGYPLIGRQK